MMFLREFKHSSVSFINLQMLLFWLFLATGSTASRLGVVPKCTLKKAKEFTVAPKGRKYCFLRQGKMSQSEAVSHCKALNSKLPLPKNNAEVQSFLKVLKRDSQSVWIDLFDQSAPGEQIWKDSEGNKPGYFQLWVAFL